MAHGWMVAIVACRDPLSFVSLLECVTVLCAEDTLVTSDFGMGK